MFHWTVSQGNIEVEQGFEKEYENLGQEIDKYHGKLKEMKTQQKHKNIFDNEEEIKQKFEEDNLKWKEIKDYKKPKQYTTEQEKFNIDYIMDMFDAAKKDKRKLELKTKYLDEKQVKRRVGEDQFEKDFRFK